MSSESTMSSMSSRHWASLEPEERRQVIDTLMAKLTPNLEKVLNTYLSSVEPRIREITRNEVGRFAVTEKELTPIIDDVILRACKQSVSFFRPRWIAKLLFRSKK